MAAKYLDSEDMELLSRLFEGRDHVLEVSVLKALARSKPKTLGYHNYHMFKEMTEVYPKLRFSEVESLRYGVSVEAKKPGTELHGIIDFTDTLPMLMNLSYPWRTKDGEVFLLFIDLACLPCFLWILGISGLAEREGKMLHIFTYSDLDKRIRDLWALTEVPQLYVADDLSAVEDPLLAEHWEPSAEELEDAIVYFKDKFVDRIAPVLKKMKVEETGLDKILL